MSSALVRRYYLRTSCLIILRPNVKMSQPSCNKYTDPKLLLSPDDALIHYEKGSETFNISFRYVNQTINVDRQFNFCRQINETVNSFLKRIDTNVGKILEKKRNRKKCKTEMSEQEINQETEQNSVKNTSSTPSEIVLYKNNSKVDGDLLCSNILEDAEDLKLVVHGVTFSIKLNIPIVTSIGLASSILTGFPTYPAKFEGIHVNRKLSTFNWYKKDGNSNKDIWTHIGQGYFYVPDVSDIGCRLKINCLPRNEICVGPVIEVQSKGVVEAGPGQCPMDIRHMFTKNKLTGKSFRVTSYNILANIYASTNFSKENLFPYCPEYALDIDYRKQLILKELIGFNSDLICLQEVDTKVYTNDLVPSLSVLNYESIYNTKNGTNEGLAIFFNQERFKILNSDYSIIAHNTEFPEFASIWSKIQNTKAKQRFADRNTILQTVALQSKESSSGILIVGNTHLYFRPDADHVRLLQAYYILLYLKEFAKRIKEKYPEENTSILLCGDFNSTPECGIYQLMTQNYIPEDYKDWRSNSEETIENVSLNHDLSFASACGTPIYTNYTPEFSGCLDYIFYEKNKLDVEQVIPMPSESELVVYEGLPSIVFPSDHISLCADLKWTD